MFLYELFKEGDPKVVILFEYSEVDTKLSSNTLFSDRELGLFSHPL